MLKFILTVGILLLSVSQAQAAELVGRAILAADTFAPGYTSGQFKKTGRTTPFLMLEGVIKADAATCLSINEFDEY